MELLLLAIPDKTDAEEEESRLAELLGSRQGGGGGRKKGGRVPSGFARRKEISALELRRVDCCAHDGSIDGLAWSACGGWLAYSCAVGQELATIRLCQLSSGACHEVTEPTSCDTAPSWDPRGRYLYFIGSRDFEPVYDQHSTHRLNFSAAQRLHADPSRGHRFAAAAQALRPSRL